MNSRVVAAKILHEVVTLHRSLDDALNHLLPEVSNTDDIPFIKALCFGSLRWIFRLESITQQLCHKPVKDKHVLYLIYLGLYQIIFTKVPPYAAISETVNAAKKLKKKWACGFINKVLREYIRQSATIEKTVHACDVSLYAHPTWLINRIKSAYPKQWESILQSNNAHPPMFLRVNLNKINREQYCHLLTDQGIKASIIKENNTAILLERPCPVNQLPFFNKGFCSVQDVAGQAIVKLLELEPNLRVLDACAAPGSKTCHIIESEPRLKKIVAIDKNPQRLQKVQQNIERLQLNPNYIQLNATAVEELDRWWDNQRFDRILLDAPCSATGVIRRHPDIKLLRRDSDIAALAKLQLQLLNILTGLVTKGGVLVYSTCSILPEENIELINRFIAQAPRKIVLEAHKQSLPGHSDGFFYAKCRCY